MAVLDRKPYLAAAAALEDTTAWSLSIHDFDQMLLRHPRLALNGVQVVPLTHPELARLAGMARETVTRVLACLPRQVAVKLTRSRVLVLDPERLWYPPDGESDSG